MFNDHGRNWKHWARRESGAEGYVRGDIRRSFMTAISSRLPWSATSVLRNGSSEYKALSIARLGLEYLEQSYKLLQEDSSSRTGINHVADAIASAMDILREGLQDLEDSLLVVENAKKPLQRQMCIAAGPGTEWSTGQLSISRDSLVFESNSEPQWSIGPVQWGDFERIEVFSDEVLVVHIKGALGCYTLYGVTNIDWLESLGVVGVTRTNTNYTEVDGVDSLQSSSPLQDLESWLSDLGGSFSSLAHDSPCHSPSPRRSPRRSPSPRRKRRTDFFDCESPRLETDQDPVDLPMADMSPSSPTLSQSFYDAAALLPAAETPARGSPILVEILPHVSIELVREAFCAELNWPPQVYLEEEMRAHCFKSTRWAKGQRFKDTMVRRLQFQMPVPADVPQAVKRLVKLPAETSATLLARIGMNEDLVVFLQEVVSHDVAYGNNFVVQEILSFRAYPEGGVRFEKFVEIRWVTALPWYAGVVGTFIEMKAKSDGKTSGEFMARYLQDLSPHTSLYSGKQ